MSEGIRTKKNLAVCLAGAVGAVVLSAGVCSTLNVNDNEKNEKVKNFGASIPCAGISLMADDIKQISGNDLNGGIDVVLKAYSNIGGENGNASISAEERVLSLIPANNTKESDEKEASKAEAVNVESVDDKNVESIISEYKVLGVANVENYLNVRETPDTEGSILGKLPMNAGCEILETLDGWYKISSGQVEGYVAAEYLLTGKEANERAKEALTTVAKVNADMLMVRQEMNTDCAILTRVAEGEEIEATGIYDGWIQVNIDDVIGYVAAEFVDVYDTLPKGVTLEDLSANGAYSSTAVELIEYAKQFLGNPYVWGGTSLTNGTDCSGFTMRIFEHFGYGLNRTSREQAHNGTAVSLDEIQPGDLLFYSHGGSIGHVAIYIGSGQIIHASTERTGIIIGNAFYTTPTCARRILN